MVNLRMCEVLDLISTYKGSERPFVVVIVTVVPALHKGDPQQTEQGCLASGFGSF